MQFFNCLTSLAENEHFKSPGRERVLPARGTKHLLRVQTRSSSPGQVDLTGDASQDLAVSNQTNALDGRQLNCWHSLHIFHRGGGSVLLDQFHMARIQVRLLQQPGITRPEVADRVRQWLTRNDRLDLGRVSIRIKLEKLRLQLLQTDRITLQILQFVSSASLLQLCFADSKERSQGLPAKTTSQLEHPVGVGGAPLQVGAHLAGQVEPGLVEPPIFGSGTGVPGWCRLNDEAEEIP